MTKSKKVKIAILILLILVVGAVAVMGFFSLQNKEFSFQNLKKSDIEEIAINTREDFYYTLDEGEIDTIYKLIKEIHPEGSGEEESEYGSRNICRNAEKWYLHCAHWMLKKLGLDWTACYIIKRLTFHAKIDIM